MAAKLDNGRAGFLDLTAELRNEIYTLALTSTTQPINLNSTAHNNLVPNILLANKTINQEATPVLYGSNTFILDPACSLPFLSTSLPFIRHIEIYETGTGNHFKEAIRLLENAKQLQRLTLKWRCIRHFKSHQSMADALKPLVRGLHDSDREMSIDEMLAVIEFKPVDVEGEEGGKWGHMVKTWRARGNQVKAILRKYLK